MNSSDGACKRAALAYLGFHGTPTAELCAMVDDALREARSVARFRAVGEVFAAPPPAFLREPYASFLAGCSACALVAMTLGVEIDRRIRALSVCDPARAVVLDACASALVEAEGDAWEARFGAERTYRFCPGYGGSDVKDNLAIFAALRPERIGMQLLDSGLMVPQKSMAGIVGIGKRKERRCGDCMLKATCTYIKEGTRCFRSENN